MRPYPTFKLCTIAAFGFALLGAFVGCKEDKPYSDRIPTPDSLKDSTRSVVTDTANQTKASEPSPLPDSIKPVKARMDSLLAAWQEGVDSTVKPKPNFTKLASDFDIIPVDSGKKIRYEQFLEVNGCTGDTNSNVFFANGDAVEADGLPTFFFMADSFTLKHGIKAGMTVEQVKAIMGVPYKEGVGMMSYAQPGADQDGGQEPAYDDLIRFYFEKGKLRFVVVFSVFEDC